MSVRNHHYIIQEDFYEGLMKLPKKNKNCMRHLLFLILFLLNSFSSFSQDQSVMNRQETADSLSLEDAIVQALENNHQIRVSQINLEIAENNVFPGNAGLLPQVFLEGSANPAIQDTDIEFAEEVGQEMPPISQENAFSIASDAAIGISYNIFDGLSKYHAYDQLKQERGARAAQSGLEIENTLLSVINTFLEVARMEQEFSINRNMVEISQRRLERARSAYEFGGETRLDVLNAEVDLNTDSVNLLRSQLELENAKRDLNILLGRPPGMAVSVMTQVDINTRIEEQFILQEAFRNNKQLQQARYNLNIAELDIQTARSGIYPRLDLNASYRYSHQYNEAGFIRRQETKGFSGGISLRYNIFNGRQRVVQTRNARLTSDIQSQQIAQITKEIERDVLNSFAQYSNTLFLLELERRNIRTAEVNFDRTEEAYRLGQATTTQYREAQLNLLNAEFNIIEQQYQAKLAEVELYRIAGILIQETR